jgi:hypothetical protein
MSFRTYNAINSSIQLFFGDFCVKNKNLKIYESKNFKTFSEKIKFIVKSRLISLKIGSLLI